MSTTSGSRRSVLRRLVMVAAVAPFVRATEGLAAHSLPQLSTDDPTAKALAYTEDASRLEASREPSFKPGSKCAICQQYQAAQASGGYAPCSIFVGKAVNASGWCRSFSSNT